MRIGLATRERIGKLLNRLGAPGLVRNLKATDAVTGQQIEIKIAALMTIIQVDKQIYMFDRLTGKLDAVGNMVI